jgi:hypothetical protein
MVFLPLLELFVAAFIILLFTTQIFMPLWKGERAFPFFRHKMKRLGEEIAEVREDVDIAQSKRTLKELRKTVKELEKDESEDRSDD